MTAASESLTVRAPLGGGSALTALSAIGTIWERELIRYLRTPSRIVTGLAQPLLFLFVLGYGVGSFIGTQSGIDFHTFVFPGVVAMSVASTATSSAISIVWDREFGFLREMLVAPIGRATLVAGKAAGGATIATAQGTIMLVFAPLAGVRLTVLTIVAVIGIEALMALALTTFGISLASRITKMEGFQVVMQLVLLPMIFLSGALFPLNGLPWWLTVLTRINPLTYAVAPLRTVVFQAQHFPASVLEHYPTAVSVLGFPLTVWMELGITAAFALVFFGIAAATLGRRS